MASPNNKLANSLTVLKALQLDGRRAYRTTELSRTHRERLVGAGFLSPVVKGWLLASSPAHGALDRGDSTTWFASFWDFCSGYLAERFGEAWHLSPEASLRLYAEDWTVPGQLVVHSPGGKNNVLALPFDTSLFDLTDPTAKTASVTMVEGIRVLTPQAALIRTPGKLFSEQPVLVAAILSSLPSLVPVTQLLLDGGRVQAAGRIANALARGGWEQESREMILAMKAAGFDLRPGKPAPVISGGRRAAGASPLATRIGSIWAEQRELVLANLPPSVPVTDPRQVLADINERYASDAYHSLSIEGYRVSAELIDRVRTGRWDPDGPDQQHRDAMAARGYWLAFQEVKRTVSSVLAGTPVGTAARSDLGAWYRSLFQPSVAAGLIPASSLAGYRTVPVYIRQSRHIPPRASAVTDGMDALMACISNEPDQGVAAVLSHWLLGYIHPYSDGNGRMARFLMNLLLVTGGYPWAVIRVETRDAYMAALEEASVEGDVTMFARFIGEQVRSE